MDWGRAKTILILSFLLLNLFLGYLLWEGKQQETIQGHISQLQIDELKLRLHQAGIVYEEAALGEDMPEMSNIKVLVNALNESAFDSSVEAIQWDGHMLEVVLKEPIPLLDGGSAQEYDSIYETFVTNYEQYHYDPYLSTTAMRVYTQWLQQYPVYSSRLQIMLHDDGWTGYRQTHYIEEEKGASRRVISAYTALAVILENGQLQTGEAIKHVQLGYTIERLDANVQFLVPAWRVVHTNGIHYINGFTGMVIGTTKD